MTPNLPLPSIPDNTGPTPPGITQGRSASLWTITMLIALVTTAGLLIANSPAPLAACGVLVTLTGFIQVIRRT